MCEIFIRANPHSYDSLARSLRLHGVATSVRLECLFWEVLEEIGQRDGLIALALQRFQREGQIARHLVHQPQHLRIEEIRLARQHAERAHCGARSSVDAPEVEPLHAHRRPRTEDPTCRRAASDARWSAAMKPIRRRW